MVDKAVCCLVACWTWCGHLLSDRRKTDTSPSWRRYNFAPPFAHSEIRTLSRNLYTCKILIEKNPLEIEKKCHLQNSSSSSLVNASCLTVPTSPTTSKENSNVESFTSLRAATPLSFASAILLKKNSVWGHQYLVRDLQPLESLCVVWTHPSG